MVIQNGYGFGCLNTHPEREYTLLSLRRHIEHNQVFVDYPGAGGLDG